MMITMIFAMAKLVFAGFEIAGLSLITNNDLTYLN